MTFPFTNSKIAGLWLRTSHFVIWQCCQTKRIILVSLTYDIFKVDILAGMLQSPNQFLLWLVTFNVYGHLRKDKITKLVRWLMWNQPNCLGIYDLMQNLESCSKFKIAIEICDQTLLLSVDPVAFVQVCNFRRCWWIIL